MFYLEKLKIDKFYLVESPTKIHFHKKFNFLLGKNGTGKTTLLEIIRAFYTLNFDFLSKEDRDFDINAFFRGVNNQNDTLEISCSETISKEKTEYSAVLFKSDNIKPIKDRFVKIHSNKDGSDFELYFPSDPYDYGIQYISINGEKYDDFPETSDLHDFLLEVYRLVKFRETVINSSIVELLLWFIHKIAILAPDDMINRFEEGLENEKRFINFEKNFKFHFDSSEKISIVSNLSNRCQISEKMLSNLNTESLIKSIYHNFIDGKDTNQNLSFSKKDSDVINEIVSILQIKDLWISYLVKNIFVHNKTMSLSFKFGQCSIVLDNETIDYDKLSYGEKRLFHIVYHIMNNRDVLLLDEPINGLHHDFIDKIFDLLNKSDSQIFIANQSPILFDYAEFENGNEFCEKFTFCKLEDKKMIWEDPTKKEIELFMEDYENQFLTTSMILRKLKLW